MPTRPPAQPLPSSSSSSIQHPHCIAPELYQLFANISFHIIPAKLEEDLGRIYGLVDQLGGQCVRVGECKFVISAVKGKPRLLRVLGEMYDKVPILTPEYIYDAYISALEYAAQGDTALRPPKLPDRSKYVISPGPKPIKFITTFPALMGIDDDEDIKPASKRRRLSPDVDVKPKPEVDLVDMTLFEEDVRFEDIPSLCVHRGSPLKCVNQDIVDAIRPIIEEREFEEAQQKNSNVLSYRRSLSVAVPRRIKSGKEAMKLSGVGDKVAQRIDEYLQTGKIQESTSIISSSRFKALNLFASVYTIGHHKAKKLYDKYNCRNLQDVKNHFEAIEEDSPEVRLKDKLRRRKRGGMKQVEIVEEWIRLKEEIDQKWEVEEIAECVMEHLEAYIPGCEYTICGGYYHSYRRGKTESNDVDIVFRPPGINLDIGLLKDLYLRLSELGIITHVLHVTHRDLNTPIHASLTNFDNLDKAFVIFKLPGPGRLHRRVDLISAPFDRYASAILSWSGSMMFERDLKRYSENVRGYKFRAGLLHVTTGQEVNLETERDIFNFLGLRYVPPELRNAD
ncbi:DNA polymerase mu subunit [Kwoniella mangroviensis CBS 10435]|uniref:DNA polymerase n=1 Tax=Kwoniella mangroviensis CBS 10435 TaxID=1331196 RepID=A0A1B9IZN9_9TREE|nr:DNA polymerase mu subunit [Kwoniella mangroviensis CBS 10435]